jgi:hypothetical protein
MAERKTIGAGEKGKAAMEPTYTLTATQLRALMGNAKPKSSQIPTAPLLESEIDATKTDVSGDVPVPARGLVNRVPRESHERAFDAFRTFSLSRFPAKDVPENYLTGDNAKDPSAVAKVQKKLIKSGLAAAKDLDTENAGMTLSFPRDQLDKINAQLGGELKDDGSGKIDLSKLLSLMKPRMNGAAFYASGNRELKRLTAETQYRAQAQGIVDSIMNRGKAKSEAAPESAKPRDTPEEAVRAAKGGDQS